MDFEDSNNLSWGGNGESSTLSQLKQMKDSRFADDSIRMNSFRSHIGFESTFMDEPQELKGISIR